MPVVKASKEVYKRMLEEAVKDGCSLMAALDRIVLNQPPERIVEKPIDYLEYPCADCGKPMRFTRKEVDKVLVKRFKHWCHTKCDEK